MKKTFWWLVAGSCVALCCGVAAMISGNGAASAQDGTEAATTGMTWDAFDEDLFGDTATNETVPFGETTAAETNPFGAAFGEVTTDDADPFGMTFDDTATGEANPFGMTFDDTAAEEATEEIAVEESVMEEPVVEEVVEEPAGETLPFDADDTFGAIEETAEEATEEEISDIEGFADIETTSLFGTEEPVVEEITEETAIETPVTEEIIEETATETPVAEEITEETATETPVVEETAIETPVAEEITEEITEQVVLTPAQETPVAQQDTVLSGVPSAGPCGPVRTMSIGEVGVGEISGEAVISTPCAGSAYGCGSCNNVVYGGNVIRSGNVVYYGYYGCPVVYGGNVIYGRGTSCVVAKPCVPMSVSYRSYTPCVRPVMVRSYARPVVYGCTPCVRPCFTTTRGCF